MRLGSSFILATLIAGIALLGLPCRLSSQESGSGGVVIAANVLPEAPQPQFAPDGAASTGQQAADGQSQSTQQPAPAAAPAQNPAAAPAQSPAQGSSSSQTPAQQPGAGESQHEKAAEQVKAEEHQRVLGIVPNFNITYLGSDTVSLTRKQKISLAFHSSTDPVAFVIPFFVAGYHEALDEDKGFPWGIKGLGERSGAAYLDSFDGNMIGNGILPAIFHQDPRYFRLGHGTTTHRLLYSLATNVICLHDNTGKWEPNYSNVLGNIASGAISNLYYPSSDSGFGLTISNGLIVTAEGGIGSIFDEFWPDISRKILHRDPTHGLDAQARAADKNQNGPERQPLPQQK
jgi:hypothetical protein